MDKDSTVPGTVQTEKKYSPFPTNVVAEEMAIILFAYAPRKFMLALHLQLF